MKPLRWKRLFWAGSVAGLAVLAGEMVINGVLLRDEWREVAAVVPLEPASRGWILAAILLTWLLGFLLIWLQLAFLPLKGGPARAAAFSALVVWSLIFVYTSAWAAAFGFFPLRLLVIATIWGLGELVLASLLAGWIYRR